MNRMFGWTTRGLLVVAAPVIFALAQPTALHAQQAPATVHGKVINAAGAPFNHGDVKFTTDKTSAPKDRKYPYSFPIAKDGTYTGTGLAPGNYLAVVFDQDKTADFQEVALKTGDDKTLDFDMTRAEYIKSLTPEEKAALETFKKNNAAATAENTKIADINKTLQQARTDEKNGKADEAVTALTSLSTQKADEPIIWASLGEAQLASADAAFAAAKAAKTSTSDPAIVQKYSDAAASYQKAIDLDKVAKKPNPEIVGASYLNQGTALAKAGKTTEAAAAFDNAVKTQPTTGATAYYNEAAILYNAGKLDDAATAADKAIAADPKRAEAYYIKAQSLIPKATLDAKTQKFQAPPGCIEAYQEYLELAPTGSHATEVKDLLTGLGQPVKNSFKAGKK